MSDHTEKRDDVAERIAVLIDSQALPSWCLDVHRYGNVIEIDVADGKGGWVTYLATISKKRHQRVEE